MWQNCIEVVRQVIEDMGEKNAGLVSAGVAFYGFFAIFPALAATIALFGLVADPVVVDEQLDLLKGVLPPDVFALFEVQIRGLISARAETLTFATLASVAAALWSVRAGVSALIQGLNSMFERPNRSVARHIAVAFVLSGALVGVGIVALLMVVVAPILLSVVPLAADQEAVLELVRWGVLLLVILVGLGIVYRYGPNNPGQRLGWVTPGAFLVVVLWLVISALFSTYVVNFGSYNEVYGSLGAVVVTLFWFYLSAFLVMLGAAVNTAIERRKPL